MSINLSDDGVTTLRITGIQEFVHRPELKKNTRKYVSETGSVSVLR
jgi:hypothetical protein